MKRVSLALAVIVLASAVAGDVLARKGGRPAGSGGWSGKGQWHGKGHGGHKHYHSHVFLGAGFYGPWFGWGPWWYGPHFPYYYPFPAAVTFEQPYIEQYAVPLQSGFWYYCHSAAAYYPGVAECLEGWEPVAPLPPTDQ